MEIYTYELALGWHLYMRYTICDLMFLWTVDLCAHWAPGYTPPSIKPSPTASIVRSRLMTPLLMQIIQSNREEKLNMVISPVYASLSVSSRSVWKCCALNRAELQGNVCHMIYITVNNWYRHAVKFSDDRQVCRSLSHQGTHLQMNYKFAMNPAEVVCESVLM